MTSKNDISQVLESDLHQRLISRLLYFILPVTLLLAISGVLTNILGEAHFMRLTLNIAMIVMLVIAIMVARSGKMLLSAHLFPVSGVIVSTVATLCNGGVQVPVYSGFFVFLTVTSLISSLRVTILIYVIFLLVGGISLNFSFYPETASLPSPFRYWTIYGFLGIGVLVIITLTRQVFNQALVRIATRESLLTSIFASKGDPLIVLDQQRVVSQMNPSAQNLEMLVQAKMPGARIIDVPLFNLETQALAPLIEQVNFSAQTSETLSLHLNIERYRAWYLVTVSPQMLESERVGTVISLRDVTDQHHLAQAQKMNAVGVLANGVAHDFNNMLSAIGNASALLSSELGPNQQEALSVIQEATRRSANLIDELMRFSRDQPTQVRTIDVQVLAKNLILLLRHLVKDQDSFRLELELNTAHAWVEGDESQLHSMFMNIGVNALQSMRGGGRLIIRIKAYAEGDHELALQGLDARGGDFLCVEMIDEGQGMTPEVLNQIFEPFFTTKGVGEGSGLGLSAAYGTVTHHGGSIDVKSEVGVGSHFRIFLPQAAPPELDVQAPERDSLELKRAESERERVTQVLVIDDELIVRKSLQRILSAMGFSALCAESGDAGLALLRESAECDVVLLDMLMPHKSGREVFYELKEEYPDLPVVLSTGFAPEEVIEELLGQGLSGVLRKPYPPSELREMIARALSREDQ